MFSSHLSHPSVLPLRTSNRASIAHSLREFFALALLSFAEYDCLLALLSLLYRHKGIKWQMLSPRRDAFLANAISTPRCIPGKCYLHAEMHSWQMLISSF